MQQQGSTGGAALVAEQVSGIVLGQDGPPVAGATVWLINSGLQQVASTNAADLFQLTLPYDSPTSPTVGYAGGDKRFILRTT